MTLLVTVSVLMAYLLVASGAAPSSAPQPYTPHPAAVVQPAPASRAPAAPAPAPAPAAPPAPATPAAPAAPPGPVPGSLAGLPGSTTQAVVVQTPSPAATAGTISTWQRGAGGAWTRVLGPVRAWVGTAGTGAPSEAVPRTPAGTWGLTQSFGRAPNPGTKLPWFHAGPSDWWVSDPASPNYNTHQVCARGTCRFDERRGENLDAEGAAYDDAVVIDANTHPIVPGHGSAFFLHVGSRPTVGCVATDRATVVGIMRWLAPAAHPVITIGR